MSRFYYPNTWAALRAIPGMRSEPVSREVVRHGELASPQYGMKKSDGEDRCGIVECPAMHRHGYIVRLKDDTLTHIGKDCAKSQLGATDWGRMRSNFSREFGSMAQARAAFEARLEADLKVAAAPLKDRGDIVEALALLRAFDASPVWFREAIEGRAPIDDKYIYELRAPSQREVKEARRHEKGKVPQHRKTLVGEIQGLIAFKQQNRIDRLVLERHPATVRELATALANETAKARNITEAARRVEQVEDSVRKNCARLRRFFEPGNLETLLLLPRIREQGIRQLRLLDGDVPRLDFM